MLDNGYSEWKYDRGILKKKLNMLLPTIIEVSMETDATSLIVSGTSGVWLGSLLTMQQDLPVVLVRKDGENSHGSIVEGNTDSKRGLVIDDFISSGTTINRIARSLAIWGRGLEIVGVIEHCRARDYGWGSSFTIMDGAEPEKRCSVPVYTSDHSEKMAARRALAARKDMFYQTECSSIPF